MSTRAVENDRDKEIGKRRIISKQRRKQMKIKKNKEREKTEMRESY